MYIYIYTQVVYMCVYMYIYIHLHIHIRIRKYILTEIVGAHFCMFETIFIFRILAEDVVSEGR